jgi:TRAP-type uncharacterized transport system fused permease subunit
MAALIVLSFFRKGNRMTLGKFFLAMKNTAIMMMMVAVICGLAATIISSVELTGLTFRLAFILTSIAGGNLAALLVMTAIVCIILGMGMPTSAAYILLAVLAAPALVKLGVIPIAAHFFVFYFGVAALITPPVCPGAYVAAGIANAPPMKTAFSAARLAIATFVVPFIFVYKPALLAQGSVASIALVTVTTLIAVMGLAAGLGGYLFKPINYRWRIAVIGGALLIIHPALLTTIIGIVIIAMPVFYQLAWPRLSGIADT